MLGRVSVSNLSSNNVGKAIMTVRWTVVEETSTTLKREKLSKSLYVYV